MSVDISFDQVLSLVRRLPVQQKIKLSRELEKDVIALKLTDLLEAFKTDKLDEKLIDSEVEKVRASIYERKKNH